MNRLTVVLPLLLAAGAASLSAAEFLPLAPGNSWTYRESRTGHTINVKVGTPVYLNDRVYHTLTGYADTQLLVRVNERGNVVYWDENLVAEPILISFEPFTAGWWDANHRVCPTLGQTQEKRGSHEGPGGRWSNVVEMQFRTYSCADAGDVSEQFAENIGMLRRVVNTFAGPRTYDLVYARIGTQTISAAPTGSFSIAVTDGEPGTWQANLRIEMPGSILLRFPSSQEYEARLRDSSGQIVWTWSADKVFLQALHNLRISGGWTASIVIPHPPAIPEGQQQYTLEAWLTTGDGEPRLGGVTSVELPRR